MPVARTYLAAPQQFALTKLMHEKYAESKMTDEQFALSATEQLGFPVKATHVFGVRKNFEIPANRVPAKTNGKISLGLLAGLEGRIAALENRVEVYLKGCQVAR